MDSTELRKEQFHVFYKRHAPTLKSYFRHLGVTQAEVLADLIQDSFLESFKSWDQLRSEHAARAWLFTIGRRQLIHYLQRNRHYQLSLYRDAALTDIASPDSDQEKTLESQELCQMILTHIAQTSHAVKRQVLVAYYLEQKSFRDIAAEFSIKISTLTTWCSRFRQECLKLRAKPTSYESPCLIKHLRTLDMEEER